MTSRLLSILRFYLSVLMAATAITAVAQSNIAIYRNDGEFNQLKLESGAKINHTVGENTSRIHIHDWLRGNTSIPVAAIDSCVMRQYDIPALYITLTDYPDADMLWDKELYLNAKIALQGNGYCDDLPETSVQVRGRGNTTWSMPKKPMRIKFSKKTSVAGLKKSKNMVLLNNYVDPTLMRNVISMWLARRLDIPYANSMEPCHVFVNNNYAGAYTMTEKLGINSGSVDIDESVGMLFEISSEFDEKYKFYSDSLNMPVMVKDPDFDELFEDEPEGLTPDQRLALWQKDFNRAEALAIQGKGAEAFDMESFTRYLMLYNIVANHEIGYLKSIYIHKKSLDEDEKYLFGPAWDFDVAFNFNDISNDSYTSRPPELALHTPTLMGYLLDTPESRAIYRELWENFKNEIFPELLEFIDNYAALIEPSAKHNGLRWPTSGPLYDWAYHITSFDFHSHVDQLRAWLIARVEYLDKNY